MTPFPTTAPRAFCISPSRHREVPPSAPATVEIGLTQTWIRTVEYHDATWGVVGSFLEYLDRTGFYDTDGLLVFPNDGWGYGNWLNPKKAADAAGNPDNDALSNLTESQQDTNPWRNDTDGDTLSDGHEVTVSLTDPLDPADPGAAGGGTTPVGGPITTVTRFEAFRSRTTGTTSQANTQSSGHAGLLTLRGGAQQVASLPLVLGNSLQPETEPLKKSPQPTSEDELYLETRLVNLSYGPGGGDGLDQGGDGVEDGYWDDQIDPTTGVSLSVWVSTGGGSTGPSGNNEPPEPTQYTGDASWSENGQISTTTSGNPASLSEAISFVGGTPISPGTDWKHESAVPAGSSVGAAFTALKKSENPSQESRGSGQKMEVRLVRKEGQGSTHYLVVEKPIERTYLKITKSRNYPSNPEDEWTIAPGTEMVTFAINKDDAMSVANRQTPVPAGFLQPPVSEGKEYMVVFLPVEVLVPKLDSEGGEIPGQLVNTKEIKVAKWENAFTGSGNNIQVKPGFIDSDVDRFYIKMALPSRAGDGQVDVIVKTGTDTVITDPASKVRLNETAENSGIFISDAQLLVSDDVDDDFPLGTDEQPDGTDRTHKVTLNSKVQIILNDPNMGEVRFSANVLKKFTTTVDVTVFNQSLQRPFTQVLDDVFFLRERMAQLGIYVNLVVHTEDPPTGPNIDLTNGLMLTEKSQTGTNEVFTSEGQAFLEAIGAVGSDQFNMFFLNGVTVWDPTRQIQGLAFGYALTESDASSYGFPGYGNNLFITGSQATLATAAHEFCHAIGDLNHVPNSANLMFGHPYGGTSKVNKIGATKRLSRSQENEIYKHDFFSQP